jgi:hypothetical protein
MIGRCRGRQNRARVLRPLASSIRVYMQNRSYGCFGWAVNLSQIRCPGMGATHVYICRCLFT